MIQDLQGASGSRRIRRSHVARGLALSKGEAKSDPRAPRTHS